MAFVPKISSFSRRSTSSKAGWVQDSFPAYRLDASQILQWLLEEFGSNASDYQLSRSEDYFVFNVPQKLSESQRTELRLLTVKEELPFRRYSSSILPSLEHLRGTVSYIKLPSTANAPAKTWTIQSDETGQTENNGSDISIYKQRVNGGESSDVYACIAQENPDNISPRSLKDILPGGQEVIKVAIKTLKPDRNKDQDFEREYYALLELKKRPHPNLINLIVSFDHARIVQGNKVIERNFMFPRAMGNMKQLFRGDLNLNTIAEHARRGLWFQIPALADALDHIHTSLRLAHADLKASNILLFLSSSNKSVVAKIADFGLAADLEQLRTWQVGTIEKQSAIRYDPPELRLQKSLTPTRDQVQKGDVWKLGCVFAELITFLILGVKGVADFRIVRTTSVPGLTSDAFSPILFDDGINLKQEVRDWLEKLAALDIHATEIMAITLDMLNPEQTRPLSEEVKSRFEMTSLCLYTDGLRALKFIRQPFTPKSRGLDPLKRLIEESLHQPVYWWPLEEPKRPLAAGHIRVSWDYAGIDLHVDVEQDIGDEYRQNCLPIFSQATHAPTAPPPAFLGASSSGTSRSTTASTPVQHVRQRTPARVPAQNSILNAVVSPINAPPPLLGEEIYMCVDRSWVQPEETLFRGVAHKDVTDDMLGKELLCLYHELRGWKGRLFSWKNCFDMDFIEFACTAPNEDRIAQLTAQDRNELPQGKQDWTYTLTRRPEEMHCKLVAKEIVRSMHHPKQTHNKRHIWPSLPKKQNYPLMKDPAESGWGIRAKQGWSNFRFLVWMAGLMGLGILFMALWLALVDKKDLQSATLGAMFVPTFLAIVLGYAQNKTKI